MSSFSGWILISFSLTQKFRESQSDGRATHLILTTTPRCGRCSCDKRLWAIWHCAGARGVLQAERRRHIKVSIPCLGAQPAHPARHVWGWSPAPRTETAAGWWWRAAQHRAKPWQGPCSPETRRWRRAWTLTPWFASLSSDPACCLRKRCERKGGKIPRTLPSGVFSPMVLTCMLKNQ